jgi:hypothetical protein
MDFLDLGLFGLTIPVFYIVGLVTFIRWLVRRPKIGVVPRESRESVATELRLRASKYEGDVKRELLDMADSFSPSAPSEPLPSGHADEAPPPPHALHNMDNINLLLFLGAFLVVVSAGIFVGVNFQSLTGVFKTVFLGLFAAVFYSVGLWLYLRAPKLRPAGNTFTGIGLVLLPLVGLAAYNFTGAHDHGHGVWFVTSLVTFVAYAFTLYLTRQTYIAYLLAFTTLSMFESGVSLFDVPVYWFGWIMGFVALVLLIIGRWTGWWHEAAASLRLSANLFVPVGLIFALGLAPANGVTQLGVMVAISGLFYGYLAWTYPTGRTGQIYWLLAVVSWPLAMTWGLWHSLDRVGVAAVLLGVAVVYLGLVWWGRLERSWQLPLATVAGLLPFFSMFLRIDQPWGVLQCLAVAAVINFLLSWRLRESGLALLGILAALAIPAVGLRLVPHIALGWGWVAAAYLAMTPLYLWWRRLSRGWDKSSDAVGMSGYLMAMGAALLAAMISGHVATLLVGLAVAAGLFGLSYLEDKVGFIYASSAIKYLAALQIIPLTHWDQSAYAVIVIVVGAASYAAGLSMTHPGRAQALRYSAIMATLFGAIFVTVSESLSPIASMALGGALLWAEARRQYKWTVEEVAVGVEVLAFNWLLGHFHVEQTQLFTIPWAAYFAFLAYRHRDKKDRYDLFTVLSLLALTLPIASQALSETNGPLYGLELILIAIALVAVGFGLHNRLISWWGAGTLVVETLYQMREVLFALPKYLISAGLGLGLLAAAIILLQRRKDH